MALPHGGILVSRSGILRNGRRIGPRAYSTDTLALKNLNVCADQVRRQDHEHFLAGLFLPNDIRPGYYAIRAFNAEVAGVRDAVRRNPAIGPIRMTWWRDAIDGVFKGTPPPMPVTQALAYANTARPLTKRWLMRVVEARARDLDDEQPKSMEELEMYAEDTAASLLYLTLDLLQVKNVHADHAASHIGKAVGLTTVLRGTAHHSVHRRMYLPVSLLSKYGVSTEEVFRGQASDRLNDVVFEVASTINAHLDHAHSLRSSVPPSALTALLPAAIAERYIARLRKCSFNVFDPRLQRASNLPLQLTYLWNSWTKRY